MFKKIALKELKQLKRDKKSLTINIVFPFFVIILVAVMGMIYGNMENENEKYVIVTNSKYIQEVFNDNESYDIKFIEDTDKINDYVKKEKSSLGVFWDENINKVTCVDNIDAKNDMNLVKENIIKTLQLDKFSNEIEIASEDISVATNYKPITIKLTAVICAFLVILLSFRLNNVNSFYLTVNEKSTGNLQVLLSTPIKKIDIIIGKWIANFCSCGVLTLAILIPVYLIFVILFQCILDVDMNLLYKLPLVTIEVVIFCSIISLFQLLLGYISKSTKQAQMYLAYSPLVLFVPLSILFGIDIKNLASYVFSSIFIDCIPVLNFYDLIQISMLEIFDIKKLVLIIISNLIFIIFVLRKLINLFKSEKILIFEN
uniref:ABC transporter permease subunit n=1 Tax=uncultured Clostridium sp. TaxID=59620 RepID=UPI0025E7C5D2|nr:ABC transporter permease subunit [uncultured Clostridium sp.]